MTRPWLGVVADDVTGAGDLADAVCAAGASATVWLRFPDAPPADCDCAVVALKSRTAPVGTAVAASVAAGRQLLAAGCTTLYQKYCSTFDSTDTGNIGPVADALRPLLGPHAVIGVGTPATPRAGRTVYQGHLFVGDRLLSESPLRDHPLTPMRDPDLVAVLSRQTPDRVGLVDRAVVGRGPDAVAGAVRTAAAAGFGHLIVDALDDGDLDALAAALLRLQDDGMPLLAAGAAGLAAALARAVPGSGTARAVPDVPPGRQLILSGSCSARTREQVAAFPGPRIELGPLDLAADAAGTLRSVLDRLAREFDGTPGPVLVSSSADPDRVAEAEAALGPGRASELLEAAAGAVACAAVGELDVRRLLVAGGETSGAVVHALAATALRVGPAVGPGLAWMVPVAGPRVVLLLKSGNFGEPDLFTTAWEACP